MIIKKISQQCISTGIELHYYKYRHTGTDTCPQNTCTHSHQYSTQYRLHVHNTDTITHIGTIHVSTTIPSIQTFNPRNYIIYMNKHNHLSKQGNSEKRREHSPNNIRKCRKIPDLQNSKYTTCIRVQCIKYTYRERIREKGDRER